MDEGTVAVTDVFGRSLSFGKVHDYPHVAVWVTNNEKVTFHFTEVQAVDLINEIAEVITEIRRDG